MKSLMAEFYKGIFKENPILVLALGLCPTLAVSTSLQNALGMGLSATFVLICSNILISMFKRFIPSRVRIPSYIVIIATFVTIVELVMEAYLPSLYKQLGIFVPLIVVNCIILGRAEAFASRNGVFASFLDGLGMGIGFTFTLSMIGLIREVLGAGKIWGYPVSLDFVPVLVFALPPGALLVLGLMLAIKQAGDKK